MPTQRPRPDRTSSGRRREKTQRRWGRGNKRGYAGAGREGRPGRMQRERGKRTDQAGTDQHPLDERRPAARSNGKRAARQRIRQIGEGRRGTIRVTPQIWRTSKSGRSIDTGSTPILVHTSTAVLALASVIMRCGKRGGVTLRYDARSGKFGRRLLEKLGGELRRVRDRQCN